MSTETEEMAETSAVEQEPQIEAAEEVVDEAALATQYQEKADALESRIDRLEGRESREEQLAAWFVEQDSSVTVQPILKKGTSSNAMILELNTFICTLSNRIFPL